jgi:predicted anti-sigma-YlaC factor YlaD
VHNPGPSQDDHRVSDFSVAADEVTCQQFVELVTDYFEGELRGRTLSQVEEHLVMCDWCITYVEQMQMTISSLAALRQYGCPEPSDSTLETLRTRRRAAE